MESNLVRNYKD